MHLEKIGGTADRVYPNQSSQIWVCIVYSYISASIFGIFTVLFDNGSEGVLESSLIQIRDAS